MVAQVQVQNGQCGLCTHFGENKPQGDQLIQIRAKHEAPVDFIAECGHPSNAPLHLQVTALSGCTGFQPASN